MQRQPTNVCPTSNSGGKFGVLPLFAPSDSESAGPPRPTRILIVEDDYFVSLEIEHYLTEAGFEVTGVATTAEEALEMAADQRPELAVMDIRLAGKRDGVDAAIELMEQHGIRSIFATAHADQKTRERAEVAKPAGWLEKPYPMSALIGLVTAALSAQSRD